MAYQKLQTYQAIQVIKDDNITIPAPNEVASGTTNGTGAGLLIDSSAKFLTTASWRCCVQHFGQHYYYCASC